MEQGNFEADFSKQMKLLMAQDNPYLEVIVDRADCWVRFSYFARSTFFQSTLAPALLVTFTFLLTFPDLFLLSRLSSWHLIETWTGIWSEVLLQNYIIITHSSVVWRDIIFPSKNVTRLHTINAVDMEKSVFHWNIGPKSVLTAEGNQVDISRVWNIFCDRYIKVIHQ